MFLTSYIKFESSKIFLPEEKPTKKDQNSVSISSSFFDYKMHPETGKRFRNV